MLAYQSLNFFLLYIRNYIFLKFMYVFFFFLLFFYKCRFGKLFSIDFLSFSLLFYVFFFHYRGLPCPSNYLYFFPLFKQFSSFIIKKVSIQNTYLLHIWLFVHSLEFSHLRYCKILREIRCGEESIVIFLTY